jgi:ASCH domain
MRSARTDEFWRAYRDAAGLRHDNYDVVPFGDGAEMATELAGRRQQARHRGIGPAIWSGRRAAAGRRGLRRLARWHRPPARDLAHDRGQDRTLNSVDERFAWDEGEGERSRDWWLSAHRRFFARRSAAQDFQMHDEIETMFERFEVVWPPEIADRR